MSAFNIFNKIPIELWQLILSHFCLTTTSGKLLHHSLALTSKKSNNIIEHEILYQSQFTIMMIHLGFASQLLQGGGNENQKEIAKLGAKFKSNNHNNIDAATAVHSLQLREMSREQNQNNNKFLQSKSNFFYDEGLRRVLSMARSSSSSSSSKEEGDHHHQQMNFSSSFKFRTLYLFFATTKICCVCAKTKLQNFGSHLDSKKGFQFCFTKNNNNVLEGLRICTNCVLDLKLKFVSSSSTQSSNNSNNNHNSGGNSLAPTRRNRRQEGVELSNQQKVATSCISLGLISCIPLDCAVAGNNNKDSSNNKNIRIEKPLGKLVRELKFEKKNQQQQQHLTDFNPLQLKKCDPFFIRNFLCG